MSLSDRTVRDLLDDVAARTPAPAGGAVAALVAAQAAALAGMASRFAADARDVAAAADRLRHLAAALADDDIAAYSAFMAARRTPGEGAARSHAADVPLATAEAAAEVAALAAPLVTDGNRNLRADAATAVFLAAAAAAAAATMVAENLAGTLDDPRLGRAAHAAAAARAAADTAFSAFPAVAL